MPQAPDDLRAEMERLFGDPISDLGPMKHLADRGYILSRDWVYRKPGVTWGDMPLDDRRCVSFLMYEWDFGGFENANRT